MDPVSITIITYVSLKFVDQFLKEEGYGRLKKLFFPERKYKHQLIKIIQDTINDYNKSYSHTKETDKFPFFHSEVLFEELNRFLLFKTQQPNLNDIVEKFKDNPRIIIPTTDELNKFYLLFITKVNEDKKLNRLFIDENYKSKIYELSKDLDRIETKIDLIDSKVTEIQSVLIFKPDNNWLKKQCNQSIIDLGKRYTPELNFQLQISKIFEGLGRTNDFNKLIDKKIDDLLIKGKKLLNDKEEIKESTQSLEKNFDNLFNLHSQIDFESNVEIPFNKIDEILNAIYSDTQLIENFYRTEERKIQEEKKDYKYLHKYGYEIRHIGEFENSINDFKTFINDDICRLANNPFLVLEGEAGIGKSHMLGDIVSKRISNNYESVFLLGQHFTTDETPWFQIFKKLQLNTKSEDFLSLINERAKNSKKRIVIFIDAINEGRGKYFWYENIKSFIDEVKKYEYIGLVLSIRSSYKQLIFPKDEVQSLGVIEHRIYGFRNNEYEASKLFFSNYNIQLPNVPLLHPEFQNPLFLKLFCEGIQKSGQTKIPDGIQGISSITDFFVKNVNEILSKPNRFEYSAGINLVDKTISTIIQYKLENNLRYVSYEKAIELTEETVSKFITKRGVYLDELISEGIFSKNLFWKRKEEYEEGIYLAYERFEDHLLCKFLLAKYSNLEMEFTKGGNLFKFIEDEYALNLNKGLIDAFSIQVPEKIGKEFHEIIPHLQSTYSIAESFVESLLWRKVETINADSKDYVNNHVFSFQSTYDLFWETILSVTSIPEHYYNALSLHNHLMKYSLADRDAEWTRNLKYKYNDDSSVKRLIDWAWNEDDKSHISDESIKLSSITLAWFHTSTNRQLRDCSTKALVNLLQNKINVLIEVLKIFEKVNDPYVYERLFAVAYGCTLRTNQKEMLKELSEYIYYTIFNESKEIYPHVLLRDYARGVIEYSLHLGNVLQIDITKIRPPYNSTLELKVITNEDIDTRYELDYKSENFKDYYWGQNSILSSMATEYGGKMYGDFGRYTFESALRSWDVNTNNLSNLALEWIFTKYGYDVEKHGKFDRDIGSGRGRESIPNERIGKKYQWLALYEMVARVADNLKKFEEWGFNKTKEEPFQGPWSPYIRDIDPTILIKNVGDFNEDEKSDFWWSDKEIFNWNCSNEDWAKKSDNLPYIENLIEISDYENEQWLVLEGYPEWAEPRKIGEEKWDYAHKRLWCHIRSYIVHENEFDKFQKWSSEQNFMGRWMPESRDRYEIFNREYYWSPCYQYFNSDYYQGQQERDIHDNKNGKFIASVTIPIENYRWEEEFDKSKEETISFMKPSSDLFQGMNLQYSHRDGEFLNSINQVIAFDAKVYHNSKPYFLIKKEPFLNYLKENKLKIVWTILGEKQIIGGRSYRDDYVGMLEFSGAYHLDKDKVSGNLTTKQR